MRSAINPRVTSIVSNYPPTIKHPSDNTRYLASVNYYIDMTCVNQYKCGCMYILDIRYAEMSGWIYHFAPTTNCGKRIQSSRHMLIIELRVLVLEGGRRTTHVRTIEYSRYACVLNAILPMRFNSPALIYACEEDALFSSSVISRKVVKSQRCFLTAFSTFVSLRGFLSTKRTYV